MNKRELLKLLEKCPDDTPILVYGNFTENLYSILDTGIDEDGFSLHVDDEGFDDDFE